MRQPIHCPMCGTKMGSLDIQLARDSMQAAIGSGGGELKMLGSIVASIFAKIPPERLNGGLAQALQMAGCVCSRCETPAICGES